MYLHWSSVQASVTEWVTHVVHVNASGQMLNKMFIYVIYCVIAEEAQLCSAFLFKVRAVLSELGLPALLPSLVFFSKLVFQHRNARSSCILTKWTLPSFLIEQCCGSLHFGSTTKEVYWHLIKAPGLSLHSEWCVWELILGFLESCLLSHPSYPVPSSYFPCQDSEWLAFSLWLVVVVLVLMTVLCR